MEMWCRVIRKPISDITQCEVENKCIEPLRDCSLCFFCTTIGGTKLTEQEQEKVDKIISARKIN